MNNEPLRPDPDRLLEQAAAPHRGKLKVFFGACAGVGKTWAMLAEAQRLRAQGLDIVVGVVETHGRKDTAAMLKGLAVLPLKRQAYRGRHISEFDLDAALARRPALILMDELAHSNAPGSRHPKRWQDIEELLRAGMDVHQPFTYSRTKALMDDFAAVLRQADQCVLLPIMGSREVDDGSVKSEDLAAKIPGSIVVDGLESAANWVKQNAREGDLVVCMSCGDLYKACDMMVGKA